MNKEIIILPKFAFDESLKKNNITLDNIETKTKVALISIHSYAEKDDLTEDMTPYFSENKSNVLNLFFDDVEEDLEVTLKSVNKKVLAKCFDENDAKQLIKFLNENKEKPTFIVHCAAGVSRSGAVGTFINDYFQSDYKEFKLKNPHILPNNKVLQVLNRYIRENEYI